LHFEWQMLFYESAKCLHGRRSQLKGKYYGSIFVHYQPVDNSIWDYTVDVSSLLSGRLSVHFSPAQEIFLVTMLFNLE